MGCTGSMIRGIYTVILFTQFEDSAKIRYTVTVNLFQMRSPYD